MDKSNNLAWVGKKLGEIFWFAWQITLAVVALVSLGYSVRTANDLIQNSSEMQVTVSELISSQESSDAWGLLPKKTIYFYVVHATDEAFKLRSYTPLGISDEITVLWPQNDFNLRPYFDFQILEDGTVVASQLENVILASMDAKWWEVLSYANVPANHMLLVSMHIVIVLLFLGLIMSRLMRWLREFRDFLAKNRKG